MHSTSLLEPIVARIGVYFFVFCFWNRIMRFACEAHGALGGAVRKDERSFCVSGLFFWSQLIAGIDVLLRLGYFSACTPGF